MARARRVRREPARGVRLRGAEQRRVRAHHAGARARRLGRALVRVGAGRARDVSRSTRSAARSRSGTTCRRWRRARSSAASGSPSPTTARTRRGMITMAREQADGSWMLNGAKMWITNGSHGARSRSSGRRRTATRATSRSAASSCRPTRTGFKAKDQKGKLSLRASRHERARVPGRAPAGRRDPARSRAGSRARSCASRRRATASRGARSARRWRASRRRSRTRRTA